MTRTTLDDRLTELNMPIMPDSSAPLAWPLTGQSDITAIYDPRAVVNGFVLKVEGTTSTGKRVDFGFAPTGRIARAVMDGEFISESEAEAVFGTSLGASDKRRLA
jgi:hypothetical protein